MIKFVVFKASDDDYREVVDVNSLEEFMNFVNKIEYPVIIGKELNFETDEVEDTLTIYDDYLEQGLTKLNSYDIIIM